MFGNRNWHVVAYGATGNILYKTTFLASERGARAFADRNIIRERCWFKIEVRAAPEPGRLWQEMPVLHERSFGDDA